MSMIIGLTGKKQHGKDTVARILLESDAVPCPCLIIAFADALRDIGSILGYSQLQMKVNKDVIHPLWNRSWRQTAQFIGTDLFRLQFDGDVWVKIIQDRMSKNVSYIITDVRYDNEAKMIKAMGGEIIKVVRSGMPDSDNHLSEQGINMHLVNGIIYNDGDLASLKAKTIAIMRFL